MARNFTEAIKFAQTDYIIDLMRHIRQSYVNALHEAEYLSVERHSEVEIDPMPSNKELIKWYYKRENRHEYYDKEPKLTWYLLRDMDKDLDETNKPEEEEATEKPPGPHTLVSFTFGMLSMIALLYPILKLFKNKN